jgi:hypothetical protein
VLRFLIGTGGQTCCAFSKEFCWRQQGRSLGSNPEIFCKDFEPKADNLSLLKFIKLVSQ